MAIEHLLTHCNMQQTRKLVYKVRARQISSLADKYCIAKTTYSDLQCAWLKNTRHLSYLYGILHSSCAVRSRSVGIQNGPYKLISFLLHVSITVAVDSFLIKEISFAIGTRSQGDEAR